MAANGNGYHAHVGKENPPETPLRNGINGEQDAARDAAMRLSAVGAVPAAMKASIELGVFEILAKAGEVGKSLTAKEIASQVVQPVNGLSVINHGYLERILRLLASENVVRESTVTVANGKPSNSSNTERCYALQPVGTYFVNGREDGDSLGPLLFLEQDRDVQEGWRHLSATVLDDTTEPFRRAHGMSCFEYVGHNPRFYEVFTSSMAHHSRLYIKAVLRAYHGFQDVKCLVDVGGGTGSTLALITAKYPHIRGINFDLPNIALASPAYPGVEHVGGNMFESVPSGDAVFMKWVLDNWNDSECVTILRNCFNALPASGGKVIAAESVLPELVQSEVGAGTQAALRIDVSAMMFNAVGAKERTLHEFRKLAKDAGFASVSVVATIGFLSVLEFKKV